jgi:hypothetical protein
MAMSSDGNSEETGFSVISAVFGVQAAKVSRAPNKNYFSHIIVQFFLKLLL